MDKLVDWEGVVKAVGGEVLTVEDDEVRKFNQGDKQHGNIWDMSMGLVERRWRG